jgi:hypothetical protein
MTSADRDRYPLRLADRAVAPAMRTYRSLLASGALAVLALGAAVIAHGGGQSALVAFAGFNVGAFLVSLTRLVAIRERPAWPAPGGARRRAIARPAPAAASTHEASPGGVAVRAALGAP